MISLANVWSYDTNRLFKVHMGYQEGTLMCKDGPRCLQYTAFLLPPLLYNPISSDLVTVVELLTPPLTGDEGKLVEAQPR